MNTYKYQSIVDEFDEYMDSNYPETIYLDTLNLYSPRDKDIYSIYEEIVELRRPIFDDILNRNENTELCRFIERNRKKRVFYEHSYRMLERCEGSSNLSCKLNTIQIINSNVELNNKSIISSLYSDIENFSTPLKISIENAIIRLDDSPYERLVEFIDLIYNDKKNERFYSSYVEFYFSSISSVVELAIGAIRNNSSNYTAILLPVIYLAVKKNLFPVGTKTTLDSLKGAIKKASRSFPSELDAKYHLVSEILSMDTSKYRKTSDSGATRKAKQVRL